MYLNSRINVRENENGTVTWNLKNILHLLDDSCRNCNRRTDYVEIATTVQTVRLICVWIDAGASL